MALSDKLLQNIPTPLPGNLNKAEMDSIQGIPKSVFDSLTNEQKEMVLGINENLSKEEQMKIRGLNQLQEESELGSFSNIREMIGKLIASGAPTRKILDIMMALTPMGQRQLMNLIGETLASGKSREDTSIGNAAIQSRDYEDVPINRFNKGGIVSLKHLTRPL